MLNRHNHNQSISAEIVEAVVVVGFVFLMKPIGAVAAVVVLAACGVFFFLFVELLIAHPSCILASELAEKVVAYFFVAEVVAVCISVVVEAHVVSVEVE